METESLSEVVRQEFRQPVNNNGWLFRQEGLKPRLGGSFINLKQTSFKHSD